MAKDPAFLFYYKDVLVSCADWDADVLGWYTRLICHQADKPEGLTNDIEALAALAGVKFSHYNKFVDGWENMMKKKFEINEAGLLINIKQAQVLDDRKNFKETQAEKGLMGYYIKLFKKQIIIAGLAWETLEAPLKNFLPKAISTKNAKEANEAIFKQTLKEIQANPISWANSNIGDANANGIKDKSFLRGGAGGNLLDVDLLAEKVFLDKENFCMQFRNWKMTDDQIYAWLQNFNSFLKFKGEKEKQESDYRFYFGNWLKDKDYHGDPKKFQLIQKNGYNNTGTKAAGIARGNTHETIYGSNKDESAYAE